MCSTHIYVKSTNVTLACYCFFHAFMVGRVMTNSASSNSGEKPMTSDGAADAQLYREAGFSRKSADAIVKIDSAMTRIRRAMQRRELVNALLAELDPNLDLARLDVMTTVIPWHPGEGAAPAGEVTVGAVAEKLGIDPSRASRLVSDVIDLGYIRRAASQLDSRRIVLEPTDKGRAFWERFRLKKSSVLAAALKGWTEAELTEFARLLERYSHWGAKGLKALSETGD